PRPQPPAPEAPARRGTKPRSVLRNGHAMTLFLGNPPPSRSVLNWQTRPSRPFKVGAVAAREVSRFARNGRDWQQLIDMCGGQTHRLNLAICFDNSLLSLAFSKPLLRLACYLFCEIGHPLGCGLAKRLFPW